MNEQLTRREALVAALAGAALGGGALVRPGSARAATATASVGVVLPLSKPGDAIAGANILKAAQMWADWTNGHGGVDGQRVKLHIYDDKASADLGAKAVVTAVTKDRCSVILGGWDSTVVLAEIEQAHALHTPFFVSYAWSSEITQRSYPEVVRIGPNLDQLANAFAPFMKARGYRTVAIVKDDTAYSQGLGTSLSAAAAVEGMKAETVVYKRDSHDLRPQLRGLLARKPDALIVAGVVAPGLTLAITQARALGYRKDILLGWDFVDDKFWKATGKDGKGVIWPTFSAPSLHLTTAGLTFKHLFQKRYKRTPLVYQAFTWDQLNAWKWAVDTAGSIDPAAVVPVMPRLDMLGTMGRVRLSNTPNTVHYNQWEGVTVYFDQAAKPGATDATAKVIASVKNSIVKLA
ncbi:MAG: branched-chain amino acid transport system substrate-binding protein [Gaiellales bacterium]|nr:branched-chain amino acid transport system substrate-binding protein [Gaiellales bacterium]